MAVCRGGCDDPDFQCVHKEFEYMEMQLPMHSYTVLGSSIAYESFGVPN